MSPATIAQISCRIARVSDKTRWTFIEVECSDGVTGVGEATLNGMEPALVAHANLIAPKLVGQRALPGALTALSNAARGGIAGQVSGGLPRRAVESAVEQALWDAQGKRLGLPVADVLGGAIRDQVPLYANVNRAIRERTPEGFAAAARSAVASGYSLIKVAPFDGLGAGRFAEDATLFRAGLERIAAACDAVRGQAEVMVDCHWRLTLPNAIAMMRFAAEHELHWVECPLPETERDMPSLRRLKQCAVDYGIRLAGMEMGENVSAFLPYFDEQLYDVVMPDVKYDGGLFSTRCIAEAAMAAGVLIAPHNPSGPVCHAASLAASATLPNLLFLEIQIGESSLFTEIVEGGATITDGMATSSREPGFGITLRPEIMTQLEFV